MKIALKKLQEAQKKHEEVLKLLRKAWKAYEEALRRRTLGKKS